jgi:hypothetical protein
VRLYYWSHTAKKVGEESAPKRDWGFVRCYLELQPRERSRKMKMEIRTGTKATAGFIIKVENQNMFRPDPNGNVLRFTDTSWNNRGVSGYSPAAGAKLITRGTPESLATWEVSCFPLDIDAMAARLAGKGVGR